MRTHNILISKGLKNEFENSRGKRAISVQATEGLLLYVDAVSSNSLSFIF